MQTVKKTSADAGQSRTFTDLAWISARKLYERFVRSNTQRKLDHLTRVVDDLAARQKQDAKWRAIFRVQLEALVRDAYLADSELPSDRSLALRRFRLRSQNEEDGLAIALLKAAGITNRTFVEIGSGGTGGNSAVLAFDLGWKGLMVDASSGALRNLRNLLSANPQVKFVRSFVTSANINDLLRENGMTGEIDLMSIDIDSCDYWLLDALEACSPRVLIMEYNSLFGPRRSVTLPNVPPPDSRPKGYSGASLTALEKVAARKGYRLVICEEKGVNAFFLRNDVAPSIPGLKAHQAYRAWVDRLGTTRTKDIDVFALCEEHKLPLVEV